MKICKKFWVGLAVIMTLSIIWVTAEIDSYNVDAWGFGGGETIINNYYETNIPNTSLFNGNRYYFDEMCGSGASLQEFTSVGAGGTFISNNGYATHPCIKTIRLTATTAGIGGVIQTAANGPMVLSGGEIYDTVLSLTQQTNRSRLTFIGFSDATSATAPFDAIVLNVSSDAYNFTTVKGWVRNNNVNRGETATSYRINMSQGINTTYFRFVVAVRNQTFAEFYIYNSTNTTGEGNTNLLWNDSVSGNLPINSSRRDLSGSILSYRNGSLTGANGDVLLGVDYINLYINRSLTR